MSRTSKLALSLLLLLLFSGNSFAAEISNFKIESISASRYRRFHLLEIELRSSKPAGATLRLYALMEKGSEKSVFTATTPFPPTEEGNCKITASIAPQSAKLYGKVERWRVEVWQGNRLMASFDDPRSEAKEKAWWNASSPISGQINFGLTKKDIRRLKGD